MNPDLQIDQTNGANPTCGTLHAQAIEILAVPSATTKEQNWSLSTMPGRCCT